MLTGAIILPMGNLKYIGMFGSTSWNWMRWLGSISFNGILLATHMSSRFLWNLSSYSWSSFCCCVVSSSSEFSELELYEYKLSTSSKKRVLVLLRDWISWIMLSLLLESKRRLFLCRNTLVSVFSNFPWDLSMMVWRRLKVGHSLSTCSEGWKIEILKVSFFSWTTDCRCLYFYFLSSSISSK